MTFIDYGWNTTRGAARRPRFRSAQLHAASEPASVSGRAGRDGCCEQPRQPMRAFSQRNRGTSEMDVPLGGETGQQLEMILDSLLLFELNSKSTCASWTARLKLWAESRRCFCVDAPQWLRELTSVGLFVAHICEHLLHHFAASNQTEGTQMNARTFWL